MPSALRFNPSGSDWLVAGNKNGEKLRGGDQRGPACLGQPPSLVWMASASPTQPHPGPWDLFLTLLPGRALQASTGWWHSLQSFCCFECLHVLTQQWGSSGDPGHLASSLPTFTPTLPSPAPLSPLIPSHIVCSARTVACLCPRLATSYFIMQVSPELSAPSSRNLLSSQRPQLRCPFCALLTHSCSPKTAGITYSIWMACVVASPPSDK